MASMVDQRPQSNLTQVTNPAFILSILRNSVASRSLQIGKMAHACISKSGFGSDLYVSNNLLHFYCYCALILDALKLFDTMPERDVVSWNTIISGLVRLGLFEEGFSYYIEMKRVGIRPSQSSFASVMVALVGMDSSENCRQIHGESLKCGFSSDVLVGNALLTSYAKHGDIKDSRRMFDEIQNLDEVSFEILLGGYLQQRSIQDAFELFKYSNLIRVSFSQFAVSSLISLCAREEFIDHGIQIHGFVVKVGLDSDVSIVNSLITMYSRSYLLENSARLFDGLSSRDIITWNSLIAGCAFNNQEDVGIGITAGFLSTGLRMNESTFSSFLSCCANVTVLETAKKVHVLILKLRETIDQGTDNIILTMYCRCRSVSYAKNVFNMIEERDVVSFNLLNGLFRNHGFYEESIMLFLRIQMEGFKVDEFLYSSLISSCSRLLTLEIGKQIHTCIIKSGFEMVPLLMNSLLEMYSQCGRFDDMEKVFGEIDMPDIFTWNVMIMGYAHFGFLDKSIRIWEELKDSGADLNEFSYCAMIDICSCIGDPVKGEQIQAQIKKLGIDSDLVVMNSLITMYASFGMMEKASAIYEEIPLTDSVSWNAMICGYAQNGFAKESVEFYVMMIRSGLKPNYMTFASISKSCSEFSDHIIGFQFHAQVIKRGYESNISVSNSFITMYSKCGDISGSLKIFQNTKIGKDLVTWNSMICAYAHHGYGREALDTFLEMKLRGKEPNDIAFVGVLSACSHAGLITEAQDQFSSMLKDHGIVPSEEHYACMVDIFCRAGRVREAKELIDSMPFDPCSLIWRTLLSACRTYNNIELGELAAKKLMKLEPDDSSAYVLLSNIYASVERMEEKAQIRRRMEDNCVMKEIGNSWIWS
ncbi:Pentatricopeptide repeat [Macleaya cordata]|uniref:Pentatricopeptide repeat n=1 Tax=Macleaya cordata TaxID=56857 RepID=A0A200PZL2_MACCD|nr:Pentatricopeptide repeat [Macleaya cordata]